MLLLLCDHADYLLRYFPEIPLAIVEVRMDMNDIKSKYIFLNVWTCFLGFGSNIIGSNVQLRLQRSDKTSPFSLVHLFGRVVYANTGEILIAILARRRITAVVENSFPRLESRGDR